MLAKPYLLVTIDDQEDLSEILAEYLAGAFKDCFEFKAFTDANVALAFIEKNPVRVVISDLRMPRLSGDEINRRVKRAQPCIKTLIMTGSLSDETASLCFREGVDGIVEKPFDHDQINSSLRYVLDGLEAWEGAFRKISHTKAM